MLLVRLLVPVPIGQADNRDGPRLMCGMGVAKVVPRGDPLFFSTPTRLRSRRACASHLPYPSSQVVLLEPARWLTPVFALPGTLTDRARRADVRCRRRRDREPGRRPCGSGCGRGCWWRPPAGSSSRTRRFSTFSPARSASRPALVGLLLVAAGVAYLGRSWGVLRCWDWSWPGRAAPLCLAKEQYLILALPICLTLILASADPARGGGLRRYRTGRRRARPPRTAALLAMMAAGYWT